MSDPKPAQGRKDDYAKPRMELIPTVALEEIAQVLTFGAAKYGADNWADGLKWRRLIGAALRHMLAFSRGEDRDPESGFSHLAHAGCCIVFLIWHTKYRGDLDDRRRDPDTLHGNSSPGAGGDPAGS